MLQNLMPHTVNVTRPAVTQDASFGEVDTFATVYTSTPSFVQPVAASWHVLYAQKKIEVTHTVFFNQALTIRAGDQIAFGSRTFLVQGVRNLLELSLITVADCLELI